MTAKTGLDKSENISRNTSENMSKNMSKNNGEDLGKIEFLADPKTVDKIVDKVDNNSVENSVENQVENSQLATEKKFSSSIKFILVDFGDLGFGYDLEILAADATLGDYVQALDAFQAKYMADCRGCDGCCHERIPLTFADYFLGRGLVAKTLGVEESAVSLGDWLAAVAEVRLLGEALDVVFKRKPNGACYFLNEEKKECSAHLNRSLVCRTHCCLPKSPLALDLRGQIINCGEDELVRRLFSCPDNQKWQDLLKNCKVEDYPAGGFAAAVSPLAWQKLLLKDLVSAELWAKLWHQG